VSTRTRALLMIDWVKRGIFGRGKLACITLIEAYLPALSRSVKILMQELGRIELECRYRI